MDWKQSYPKKPGFYWVTTETDFITIYKRSSKNGLWAFGGDAIDPKRVKLWGDPIKFDDCTWSKNQPTEDGWYKVKYTDKKTGVIKIVHGDHAHCYDFDLPAEIDVKIIVMWDGPLTTPK